MSEETTAGRSAVAGQVERPVRPLPERETAASEMSRLLDLRARQAADVQVLEAAVKVMGNALNDLLVACYGPDGKPKAPDKKEVMRARSMLPPRYSYALSKKA